MIKCWILRIFLLLCCVWIGGCQSDQSSHSNNLSGSTYTGVIPCADCEGISYELSLNDNNRYQTSSVYIGESNRPFIKKGSWSIQEDTLLVLDNASNGARTFAIQDDELVMLNKQRKRIKGSLAQMYVLQNRDAAADHKTNWENLREKGIDFRAAGNEPSWNLTIDFDKMLHFKTLNDDSIYTPVPAMQKDTASNARIMQAQIESGSISVKLYPTGCMDDMSGQVFDYYVKVAAVNNEYSGCGNFINAEYELNDWWTLHALNGSELSQRDTARQVPSLQFNLADLKVFGNTGCNQFNGSIALQDSSLSFSKMMTTRMACPGDMESRFVDALQGTESYTISHEELLLKGGKDTLAVFWRAE